MTALAASRDDASGRDGASAAESWVAAALDGIDEGLIVWDDGDRVVAWNGAVVAMFPYLLSALHRGATAREVFTAAIVATRADMPTAEQAKWVERRLAERQVDGVVEFVGRDGRVIEIVERRTPNGGFVSLYRDVTLNRRAARAHRESEARFRDGIASMADGFTMWDRDDRLLAWNDQFVDMNPEVAGRLVAGMTFASLAEIVASRRYPDAPAAERAEITARRIARHRNPGPAFEIDISDGRIIEVMERRTTEGGVVSVHRDVTSRHETQRALERALDAERELNQVQRHFLSFATHEFRTPLAIILSAVQRLQHRFAAQATPETNLRFDRIHAAVGRMGALIDRMLTSARADEGRLAPRLQAVDAVTAVRAAIANQATISPEFEIALAAPEAPCTVAADPGLLDQILANLLSNAIKYSGASRRIEVCVSRTDTEVAFAVRDHGIGIPRDQLPKLFTRFFRARTAEGIAGTGIGLHLVRTLVGAHKGRIAVDTAEGVGSTFTVHLPQAAATESGA